MYVKSERGAENSHLPVFRSVGDSNTQDCQGVHSPLIKLEGLATIIYNIVGLSDFFMYLKFTVSIFSKIISQADRGHTYSELHKK